MRDLAFGMTIKSALSGAMGALPVITVAACLMHGIFAWDRYVVQTAIANTNEQTDKLLRAQEALQVERGAVNVTLLSKRRRRPMRSANRSPASRM